MVGISAEHIYSAGHNWVQSLKAEAIPNVAHV
jgi:hypothetical protein